jgi:hypothetical protein
MMPIQEEVHREWADRADKLAVVGHILPLELGRWRHGTPRHAIPSAQGSIRFILKQAREFPRCTQLQIRMFSKNCVIGFPV